MTGMKHPEPYGDKPRFFYGYIVVVVAFITTMIAWGINYSFGVFFTPMIVQFGWTRAVTSGAISLAMLTEGLGGTLMGWLNDRFGARVVVTLCGLLLGLGCILTAQTSYIWQLYLFYGLTLGLGLSASFVSPVSTVARWFAERRIGMMTGIATAGSSAGALVMSPLANQLILAYGWRTSYVVIGVTASVIIVSVAQLFKRPPQGNQAQYDTDDTKSVTNRLELRQYTLEESTHTRQFWLACGAFICFGICEYSIMVHIVPHGIVLGLSPTIAASVLAVFGALSVPSKIIIGNTIDKFGSRRVLTIGFISILLALLWLQIAREPWMLYLFAAVFAFGIASGVVALSTIVVELFGIMSHGILLGILNFTACVGCTIGPVLTGYLFDMNASYTIAFLVSAIIAAAGLALTILITSTKTN